VTPRKFVQPNTLWRHRKGGLYLVLGFVTDSTNGPQDGRESVLYYSLAYKAYRHRETGQFLDGRFVPLNAGGDPMCPESGE
jgi:hypothetical protein